MRTQKVECPVDLDYLIAVGAEAAANEVRRREHAFLDVGVEAPLDERASQQGSEQRFHCRSAHTQEWSLLGLDGSHLSTCEVVLLDDVNRTKAPGLEIVGRDIQILVEHDFTGVCRPNLCAIAVDEYRAIDEAGLVNKAELGALRRALREEVRLRSEDDA